MKITQTKSGKFQTKLAYYDIDGKRRFKTFTAKTRKEAQQLATLWEIDHKDFTSQPSYGNLTVEQAIQRYIDSKSKICSPSTLAEYTRLKEKTLGMLGRTRLSCLTVEVIQIAVNEYSAGHAPKGVRNWFGLISSTLKVYAPELDLSKITLPAKQKTERKIPTTEEVKQLLSAAKPNLRVAILLASQGGLRRSEICALTPEDIADTGISVNKAVVEDGDHNLVVKSTKTFAGTRFVPLSPSVIAELRGWEEFGMSPRSLEQRWYRLCRKLGFSGIGFHSLRHYFASMCHANGIPDKYICEIGGWENTATLQQIYQHAMKDKREAFSSKVVSLFESDFLNSCGEIVAKSS